MVSTHNIRRPAFWLVLTCLGAVGFFVVTDPRVELIRYATGNDIDAVRQAEIGTLVGIAGSGILLVVGLFLCTRKGAPPTGSDAGGTVQKRT